MIAIRICRKCGMDFDAEFGSSTAYCDSCLELMAKEDAKKIRQIQQQEGMSGAPLDILRLEADMDTIRFGDESGCDEKGIGYPEKSVKTAGKPKKKKANLPMRLPKSGISLLDEMYKERKS